MNKETQELVERLEVYNTPNPDSDYTLVPIGLFREAITALSQKPVVPDIAKFIGERSDELFEQREKEYQKNGQSNRYRNLDGRVAEAKHLGYQVRKMLKDAYIADGEPVDCCVNVVTGELLKMFDMDAERYAEDRNRVAGGDNWKAIRYIPIKENNDG
jgi:hypothetical protein